MKIDIFAAMSQIDTTRQLLAVSSVLKMNNLKPEVHSRESEIPWIERNVSLLSILIVGTGSALAIALPYVLPLLPYFDVKTPNEIGDAFGGISNPVVGLMGVCLTFLAFYIQYKANMRQTNEIEAQKRENEYKFIEEGIRDIKSDIRSLRYTKAGVTYEYAEAIWYYMTDHAATPESKAKKGAVELLQPIHYQIAYVLTLFEPLINNIDHSKLTDKEKCQLLQNVDGLFEASLAYVLRVHDNLMAANDNLSLSNAAKTKIVIPAKRIRQQIKDVLQEYKESEKELFNAASEKIRGAQFIKTTRFVNGKGTLVFFKNYNEYFAAVKTNTLSAEEYEEYFSKEDNLHKLLIVEPVKLLMKLEFLEKITFQLPANQKFYNMAVDRKGLEVFMGYSLEEFKIDKDLWRDKFMGRYMYDRKDREAYEAKFLTLTSNNV